MSNKYGLAAVCAVQKIRSGECRHPREAWDSALSKYYPKSAAAFKKGCPRNAFLGLCEAGLIDGVEPGVYTKSIKNKRYALKAVKLLRDDELLLENIKQLWIRATGKPDLIHNSQMNVVVELFKHGLINNAAISINLNNNS